LGARLTGTTLPAALAAHEATRRPTGVAERSGARGVDQGRLPPHAATGAAERLAWRSSHLSDCGPLASTAYGIRGPPRSQPLSIIPRLRPAIQAPCVSGWAGTKRDG